jgi:acetyl esterase/lipase
LIRGRAPLPAAISAEARAFIQNAPPLGLRHDSLDAVAAERRANLRQRSGDCEAARAAYCERVEEIALAGRAVQRILPKGYDPVDDGKAVLHFFGGGYLVGSPFEELTLTAPLAARLGLELYVPHYRLAPEHPFPAALEDAYAVYEALLDRYGPGRLAVTGESAGGGLALAALLRARDAGLPLPAAAALLSPWCDLTKTGDTQTTLTGLDPTLAYEASLEQAARAYADGRELREPLLSPVYADYGPGFCPTLITSGTRDLFLSDCARLSTALRRAGVDAALHVWEGMWHVFEWYPEIPEAGRSLDEIAAHLARHLS